MVVKKKKLLALLCIVAFLFSGCGTAGEKDQEALQKITVGEVAHSILTPPKR